MDETFFRSNSEIKIKAEGIAGNVGKPIPNELLEIHSSLSGKLESQQSDFGANSNEFERSRVGNRRVLK